jgi:hypothetical protein
MHEQLFTPATAAEIRAAGDAVLHGQGTPPGRIFTPEELTDMATKKKTHRLDGAPRVNNRTPVRTFRCPDAVWELATKHGASYEGGVSGWIRHAIERYAAEADRQAKYAKQKKGKKATTKKV